MHPTSQQIIGQILNPTPASDASQPTAPGTRMTLEQIVQPKGTYSGPERRAQGTLVAEVIPDAEVSPPAREPGV